MRKKDLIQREGSNSNIAPEVEVRFKQKNPNSSSSLIESHTHSPPKPTSTTNLRSLIRKSLLSGTSESQSFHSGGGGGSDSDDEDAKKSCPCVKKLRSHFHQRLRVFNEVSAHNLKIRTGAQAGLWDYWGVYYCSSRFGRQAKLNPSYFYLAALFVISQGSMLNLVYYMKIHGGSAFLVVLIMVYITVGYPLYLFETMMGQYSARKPMLMLRFMLPALTGIGPALYLRTIIKAVNALGNFIYCSFLAFSLFFCKTDNVLVYRFVEAEQRNKRFHLLVPHVSRDEGGTIQHDVYEWWWLIISTVALFILVAQNLKLYGELASVTVSALILGMFGYLLVGVSRISSAKSDSVVFIPLRATFHPDWISILDGQAWLDAIIFVIQSMELGTLVHPYLGSKNFFHYRSHRDGLILVLLAIVWNIGATTAALAWLGYIGVNEEEMMTANSNLFGHYGLIIVFMLKHLQAEMTQNVQGDVLFFNGCFYAIVGIASVVAFIVYVIIIVDCSFPESGQLILKALIMVVICVILGGVAPSLLMHNEGIRRLIFINFYVHKNWSAFFVVGCYFAAVGFGHDSGKFVHDFLNIIHLKGYQSKQHSYHVPRILRYFVLAFMTLGMISYIFTRPYPHEGQTDWSGGGRMLGIGFSCVPLIVVVSVAIFYRAAYGKASLKSHRDWFKNKHHKNVCFADFANFKGIPALMDPQPAEQEQPYSRRHSR